MKEDIVKQFTSGNFRVSIIREECPENPADSHDGLGYLASWDNRRSLLPRKYNHIIKNAEEMGEWIEEQKGNGVPHYVLGFQYYYYGGLNFGEWDDGGWDGGWDGAIFIDLEYFIKYVDGSVPADTSKYGPADYAAIVERMKEICVSSAQLFDCWSSGDVFRFILEQDKTDLKCRMGEYKPFSDCGIETVDSCGGYYKTEIVTEKELYKWMADCFSVSNPAIDNIKKQMGI